MKNNNHNLTKVCIYVDEQEFETFTDEDIVSPAAMMLAMCHLASDLHDCDVDLRELFTAILEDIEDNNCPDILN